MAYNDSNRVPVLNPCVYQSISPRNCTYYKQISIPRSPPCIRMNVPLICIFPHQISSSSIYHIKFEYPYFQPPRMKTNAILHIDIKYWCEKTFSSLSDVNKEDSGETTVTQDNENYALYTTWKNDRSTPTTYILHTCSGLSRLASHPRSRGGHAVVYIQRRLPLWIGIYMCCNKLQSRYTIGEPLAGETQLGPSAAERVGL